MGLLGCALQSGSNTGPSQTPVNSIPPLMLAAPEAMKYSVCKSSFSVCLRHTEDKYHKCFHQHFFDILRTLKNNPWCLKSKRKITSGILKTKLIWIRSLNLCKNNVYVLGLISLSGGRDGVYNLQRLWKKACTAVPLMINIKNSLIFNRLYLHVSFSLIF